MLRLSPVRALAAAAHQLPLVRGSERLLLHLLAVLHVCRKRRSRQRSQVRKRTTYLRPCST